MINIHLTEQERNEIDCLITEDDAIDDDVVAEHLRSMAVRQGLVSSSINLDLNAALKPSAMQSFVAAEGAALARAYRTALLSADGRVLRASQAYAELFGCSNGELVGRRRRELAMAPNWAAYDEVWPRLRGGERCELVYRATRVDGGEVWIAGQFEPTLDGNGVLSHVVEIATDLSLQLLREADVCGQVAAINASLAVIEFDTSGVILEVNEIFAGCVGYGRDELVGRHHRLLVDTTMAASDEYRQFWSRLADGESQVAEFRRVGKHGQDVWLQASYNPIFDPAGRVMKVVKYATDVTQAKLRQADFQWQIAAIHKSQAVVTFSMDGLILDANELFLDAVGYELLEIVGRHHRMFVDQAYSHSVDYAAFWRRLGQGHYQSGQYSRRRKDGSDVWLQATYNPVFDLNGKLVKVVKYATVVTEEKLRQAEHQGQIAAIDRAKCVISFDLNGVILDANDNFVDTMGYRLADVRGRHHSMFVDPDEVASAEYKELWKSLSAGQHRTGEFRRICRDGNEVWLQATYSPIYDLSGRPFRVVKYATDVTAEKLRSADVLGQIAAIRESQGVITFDMDGVILDANTRFSKAVEYSIDELRGRHHSMLVETGHAASVDYQTFWDALRAGQFQTGLFKRIGKGGRIVWIQASYNPILGLDCRPFKVVQFATDVTENVALSEAFEDAKRQAQHDPATSLPNRVRLASFVSNALMEAGAKLWIFYMDLDRFKPINDTHGHQAGDMVLGQIADRLRRILSFDQLAARVGGDEFVVVATDLDESSVESFAQRLIDAVSAPIHLEVGDVKVGVSIGIASGPHDGQTPDELLRCADIALYRSKQNERGTYTFFSATLNERLQSYRHLVDDIRRGLNEDQFVLEFQPRYRAQCGTMCGVEALVRWNHPERGRLAPNDFIGVAERSGLISELGTWVMRTACRAAINWPGLNVSVNVSPVQFIETDLVALVQDILGDTGLAPHRLELELTEGVLLEDPVRARITLNQLKAVGIRLAMDDFGTGYSSLSSLRAFPFDVIKIDRQFISDIEGRAGGREVVQAVLSLGRALGMSVTAEGVETEAQRRMLTEDKCDELQGFLLSRPRLPEQISRMLHAVQHAPVESTSP